MTLSRQVRRALGSIRKCKSVNLLLSSWLISTGRFNSSRESSPPSLGLIWVRFGCSAHCYSSCFDFPGCLQRRFLLVESSVSRQPCEVLLLSRNSGQRNWICPADYVACGTVGQRDKLRHHTERHHKPHQPRWQHSLGV